MKKQFVLFVSILLCVSYCVTAKNQGSNENAPFITREFPASSIKEVGATTSGGSITLAGDAGSKAVVEVYISHDNWSNEKIKQVLDENYTLDIKVVNGKLVATAKQKTNFFNWDNQGLSISFKISVSKQVDSNLQTSGGSLSIDNVSGSMVGVTSGGSISVTNSKDNIDLKTSGGSITAKDCGGKISLNTSGGSINLGNLAGNINARTSGGSIMADNINGTLVTGTSGGSVKLNGISGNVDATTSGGNMDVRIKSASDYVKLSNSGSLNLVLPDGKNYSLNVKASRLEAPVIKNFQGRMDNKSINGTIGNGGTDINVRSSQQVTLTFE